MLIYIGSGKPKLRALACLVVDWLQGGTRAEDNERATRQARRGGPTWSLDGAPVVMDRLVDAAFGTWSPDGVHRLVSQKG
ncbi:hypothetical protein FA95DRAFT_1559654 [Auriscalpium vulgare]|uniref:Uncharacterized protein n=1 Tax=Auriscalpium vulgare TaxID=40419 RepID=A0ACB8RRU2_9AGAM|nr:hypothetical protein FA95DRAFT_1559654 [Auriscalpium vulgare]